MHKLIYKRTLLCGMAAIFLTCFGVFRSQAQDVEELWSRAKDTTPFFKDILRGDPFSLSGSYGFNLRSYNTDGTSNRQTPLSSTLYGQATAQIYSITIPANFILNNLDDFHQPFHKGYLDGILSNQRNRLTRIGISPYYKWIKLHAGHRYMNFSDYTLSNHNFLGGGVELTPGKFRFSAMAGRLAKAEPVDIALDRPTLPVYRRTGWGIKAGYGGTNDYIDLILFRAEDDATSLTFVDPEEEAIQPAENLVLGIKGRKTIGDRLNLDFELSRSGHTRNLNDPLIRRTGFSMEYDNPLFRRKISTSYGNAGSAKLQYRLDKMQVGLGYERIDPEFMTFGAYFFNKDLENYTASFSGYGIKDFSFNATAGLQKNNLDKTQEASYRRLIGSLDMNYLLDTWVFGLNYSNYTSDTRYVLNEDYNSLKVVIVTSDASVNISKNLKSDGDQVQNINFRSGIQKVNQNVETPTGNPATNMYYANLSYGLRFLSGWNLRANTDFNQNSISRVRQSRFGAGANIGRSWFENKLDLSAGAQVYVSNSPGGELKSRQANENIRLQWRMSDLQTLQFQISSLQNHRTQNRVTDRFNEVIFTLGFTGQFDYRPFDKNNARDHE